MISVLSIVHDTMVDGPGFRTSIYCAGCPNHCPGCHNPQSWDISHGTMTSTEELMKEIMSDPFANVTFSGGDPMFQALAALQSVEWLLDVVIDWRIVEVAQVFACQLLQVLYLFMVRHAYVWSQIEPEDWDGLASLHLVLAGLDGDASQDGCGFDALGRPA